METLRATHRLIDLVLRWAATWAERERRTSHQHPPPGAGFRRVLVKFDLPTVVRDTTLTCVMGAPPGTRTPNPLIKSQLLCQLS